MFLQRGEGPGHGRTRAGSGARAGAWGSGDATMSPLLLASRLCSFSPAVPPHHHALPSAPGSLPAPAQPHGPSAKLSQWLTQLSVSSCQISSPVPHCAPGDRVIGSGLLVRASEGCLQDSGPPWSKRHVLGSSACCRGSPGGPQKHQGSPSCQPEPPWLTLLSPAFFQDTAASHGHTEPSCLHQKPATPLPSPSNPPQAVCPSGITDKPVLCSPSLSILKKETTDRWS